MVECDLAKVEVAGSNPVSRSNFRFVVFSGSRLAEARTAGEGGRSCETLTPDRTIPTSSKAAP